MRKRKPLLILAGLGLNFPRQATLEALEALSLSDTVVNNLYGESALEFLSLFCKDIRTISYQGGDEARWVREVFKALRGGRTVTFVTRGHPLVSGHLAQALLERARREGVEARSLSAISTIDELLAVSNEVLGETARGVQVYETGPLFSGRVRLQRGVPAVIYFAVRSDAAGAARARRAGARLAALLRRAYPPRHEVFLYLPPYELRRIERLRVAELAGRLAALDPRALSSVVVFARA